MRYRLLYGLVISSVISVAVAIFSQQPVMAANAVPPEHIFCTAVAAEIRDHKVDGEVYKACFYQGKQVNVERITCPTGSSEEVSGSVTNSTVVRRCVSSAPRCEDGLKEVNGRCVDTKKNREETFNTVIRENLIKESISTKAFASFQSNCRGNSECLNTDYDKFLRTYFADQVYLCMQPAATAAEQAKTELGLQGGTAPDEAFANCIVSAYPSVNKAAVRQKAKDIDFINSLATINQKTTSDKISDKPSEKKDEAQAPEKKGSCGENLPGLGWVICPLMDFGGKAADGAMSILRGYLTIKPALLDTQSGTYAAWSYFRNLANAAFVIIFLWIVFSQITNVGISNYGIKRLLPRLVIGAILVNISYYIAQIAVDVSNILGFSLEQMFEQARTSVPGASPDAIRSGLTWATWIGTTLAVAAAAIAVLVLAGGSVLLASLLAIAVVLIILIVRQAAVILLVAVSPLAFAAWLLPNTESLFKKWLTVLKAVLVVFPIISLLYGASELASQVLMTTATAANPGEPDWLLQLAALAVVFVPLGATPFALRSSMNALGSVGGMINKLSTKANARVGTKIKNNSRLGEAWKNQKFKSAQRQANRRAGNGWLARQGRELTASGKNKFVKGLGRAMSLKGDMTRAIDKSWAGGLIGGVAGAAAANTRVNELFEQEVKASGTLLQGKTMSEIKKIASDKKSSAVMRTAALDMVMSQGGFKDRNEALSIVASDSSLNGSIKSRVIQAAYAKGDGTVYGNDFGDNILTGTIKDASGLEEAAFTNAVKGNLQPEHLVQGAAQAEYIVDVISDRLKAGDPRAATARLQFRNAAARARSNANTSSKLSTGGAIDRQISRL